MNFSDIPLLLLYLPAGQYKERERGGGVNMNDNTDAIYRFTHTHTEWLYMDIVAIVALLLSFVPSNSLYNISPPSTLCVSINRTIDGLCRSRKKKKEKITMRDDSSSFFFFLSGTVASLFLACCPDVCDICDGPRL